MAICAPLLLTFLTFAILLFAGKSYRLIAGNQDASDEEPADQKSRKVGVGVGVVMLLAALTIGATMAPAVASLAAAG